MTNSLYDINDLETSQDENFFSNSMASLNYERDVSQYCSSTCAVSVSWGQLSVIPRIMEHKDEF